MKKTLFIASLLKYVFITSQVTLLDENFDSFEDFAIGGFGEWQTLDMDKISTYAGGSTSFWPNRNQPQAYMIFNPYNAGVLKEKSAETTADFRPHSGTKYAACWSSVASSNEDWLITPPIMLGTSGNELSFWVKALARTYGQEKYKVGVYFGDGHPKSTQDFTIISGNEPLSAPHDDWKKKEFNLDAYSGKVIRLGIQCVSQDVYMLMVDDVKVVTGEE